MPLHVHVQQTPRHRPGSIVSSLARNVALQDLALTTMLARLSYVALRDTPNATPWQVRLPVLALLVLAIFTIVSVRGGLLEPGPGRALLYRMGMLACVAGSYFALSPLLPALTPHLLDRDLLRQDELLFGRTPAAWLDSFVNYASVEWFAFFYYSFYVLIATFALGTLLFDSGRRRYELLLAVVLVMSVGHMGYTFVPGAGPYACPGLHFEHALRGGAWWSRVEMTVRSAGAKYDIFPSLHTALSVTFAAHAVRHRRSAPYRYVWAVVCVWVANIVVATVFLRWHYGVDVLAGFALACAAQRVSVRLWEREEGASLYAHGRQPIWEALLPERMPVEDRRFVVGIFGIQMLVCLLLLAAA